MNWAGRLLLGAAGAGAIWADGVFNRSPTVLFAAGFVLIMAAMLWGSDASWACEEDSDADRRD